MIQEIQETNDVATAEQSGLASADCSGRQRLSHYALFKHMADVHELTLIDDELEQIALSVKDDREHYWKSLSDSIGHFVRAATERTGSVQTGIEMRESALELSKLYFREPKG